MSHWVRFCSTCPAPCCPNPNRVIYWTCSNDDYGLYINEDGYIKCGKNGCNRNIHPDFILDTKFSCGEHHSIFRPDKMRVLNAFAIASHHYGNDFCKQILQKIVEY